jgi:CheY-like chemotaxis protein
MRTKAASVSESATAVSRPVTEAGARSADLVPHVLVADSDAATRAAREAQLRAAGLRVSVARTGFEAIVKASYHLPDLILLDDSLNDIERTETARLLQTCPATAHIPIVRLVRGRGVSRRVLTRLTRAAM